MDMLSKNAAINYLKVLASPEVPFDEAEDDEARGILIMNVVAQFAQSVSSPVVDSLVGFVAEIRDIIAADRSALTEKAHAIDWE
jgi:hypothetical protein